MTSISMADRPLWLNQPTATAEPVSSSMPTSLAACAITEPRVTAAAPVNAR